VLQTHLSPLRPSLVENQTAHVVGEVDQYDLGLGALDADGAYEQTHVRLFLSKDVFDRVAYYGLGPVGGAHRLGFGFTLGFLAVDAADLAICLEPRFIGLRAVSKPYRPRRRTRCCLSSPLRAVVIRRGGHRA
jgi:hypothetical protein